MTEDPRAPLLRRVLAYELPIKPVLESLAALPYDCGDDLVLVSPKDVIQIIDRCTSGELSVAQATDWADLLEARDGVGFAQPRAERVAEIISRIANPTLYGDLTLDVLGELRAELAGLGNPGCF
jgi:hypothetical protein